MPPLRILAAAARPTRRAALALTLAALAAPAPAAPDARRLTVVELFQSQGCSSCPPANANVNALADRTDLLVLSYGVTYWDDLGWKDTFATQRNTARQWAYAHGLRRANVSTPQVVLNGRRAISGIDRPYLDAAVQTAVGPDAVEITASATEVRVRATAAPARPADVWLLRYDPQVEWVSIRRGENGGKTLPHRNVVKQLERLGAWSGGSATYPLRAPPSAGLRTAILVQGAEGGPILGAAKLN